MNQTESTHNERQKLHEEIDLEQVWQFAGQGLKASDFNTAMVHFYRGEMQRSNTWRTRLDATTNWAVITTGAALTFAFGSATNSPVVIIIDALLVLLFLFIEARRYRYYELWTYRVRIMEQNFFAALLSPPFLPHADWADKLTDSINHPRFPITLAEAFGRRYRRNYALLFLVLLLSWVIKVVIHPTPLYDLSEFLDRAAVGPVPGSMVVTFGLLFNLLLLAIGLFTVGLQASPGEVLEAAGLAQRLRRRLRLVTWEVLELELPHLNLWEARSQLVYIISDDVEAIGRRLLQDLERGVTLLRGTGLYTGREHGVLLCALKARQLGLLKRAVHEIDPRAFVIVTPLHSVHGTGFRPLEA